MDDVKLKIKEAVLVLFPKAGENTELLNYVVSEVLFRTLLYLNYPTDYDFKKWNERFNPVIARAVMGVYTKSTEEQSSGTVEAGIASLSDNGQSISYKDTAKQYLATATDNELFGSLAAVLKPYRRVHVISKRR